MNQNKKSKISLAGLEDLNQIVKSEVPFSNRKVMIPLTSKAFFEGTLEPTIQKGQSCNNDKIEQLIVNLGQGYLSEMTKDEASEYIDQRMKALRPIVEVKRKVKKDAKLKLKKGFLQSKKPAKKNATRRPSSPTVIEQLPFIEIREEFDRDGNEIKGEAVNMSKQLHNVRQAIQSKKGESGTRNEILDTLLDSVPESTDIEDGTDEANILDTDMNTTVADMNEVETNVRPYTEISARLDELILLEEEERRKKNTNAKSSKRLQGKGWAKGFLSNNKQVSKKKGTTKKSAAVIESSISKPDQRVVHDSSRAKKVQFRTSNEVKEIPRIGTRSIESAKVPSQDTSAIQDVSSSLEKTMLRNASTGQNRPSKSIQMGNIVERNGNDGISKPSPSISGTSSAGTEPKRKLSKFAQRRQQQNL
jgi:prefoldin subunit 5